jgi:molybdate transport system regulatory protein
MINSQSPSRDLEYGVASWITRKVKCTSNLPNLRVSGRSLRESVASSYWCAMGNAQIRPRLRVLSGSQIALGPGKVELLEAVNETGSITAAATRLNMSYMRAWTLIRTMNRCFKQPLVSATHGGPKGGGGAELTPAGLKVVELYRRMDAQCLHAIAPSWKKIQGFLA